MPKRTIELLDCLEDLGFTDAEFRLVHHMPDTSIRVMRRYCEEHASFQGSDSTNAKVLERLEIVAKAFQAAGFSSPARSGVFAALAAAAVSELPIG